MNKEQKSNSEPGPSKFQPAPFIIFSVLTFILTVGSVFYHRVEKLEWLDSIYFSVITLTTVGYGDISPKTDAGKIFTIFYVLIGIGIVAFSANYLLTTAVKRSRHKK